jgi:hypothetical protein
MGQAVARGLASLGTITLLLGGLAGIVALALAVFEGPRACTIEATRPLCGFLQDAWGLPAPAKGAIGLSGALLFAVGAWLAVRGSRAAGTTEAEEEARPDPPPPPPGP